LEPGDTIDRVAYWPLDVIEGTKLPDLKSGCDLELVSLVAMDLVTGCKGTHLMGEAEEKRPVGPAWAAWSGGNCLHVMPGGGKSGDIAKAISF
jgi:hypothetical protein